jgi:general secretion pathway protein D
MNLNIRSHWLGAGLLALVLAGCQSNPAYKEGQALLAKGQMEAGIAKLEQAAREEPGNIEIRSALATRKLQATQSLLNRADKARLAARYQEAAVDYSAVLRMEPANPRATQGLEQVRLDQRHAADAKEAETLLKKNDLDGAERLLRTILTQDSEHRQAKRLLNLIEQLRAKNEVVPTELKSTLDKKLTLEFRDAPLKSVFEVLARSSGVNFVFDKDVRGDAKVTIFVRDSSLNETIRLILATQQLQRKFLNDNSILIYPDTPVKTKVYQELVVKNFYLGNADAKQAQALIKSVLKTRDTFVDEKLNLLVVKDTPEAVRLAERLIGSLDLAEPEVMLDVEVLEVSRSKLLELGLRFPDYVGYGILTPNTTTTTVTNTSTQTATTLGGQVASGMVDLHNRSALTSYVVNPAVRLNLVDQDGDGSILANPRIRVRNRQKAKIHIGAKLPVFTTTSTANVGVSSSVSYLDVGLKLDVEPQVYLDDEVGIKVGLEVSSVTKEVTGPQGAIAYEVGTRNADTILRLKNGETQVLAGLINDEERSSANRLPGLGDIPVLGRLFSSQRDTHSKTEIVLLITPRIIRNIARPGLAEPAIPFGTQANVGERPLTIKAKPNSLRMSGRGTPGGMPTMPHRIDPGAMDEGATDEGDADRPPIPQLRRPPPPAPVPGPASTAAPDAKAAKPSAAPEQSSSPLQLKVVPPPTMSTDGKASSP